MSARTEVTDLTVIGELARIKVMFQQRAIATVLGIPADGKPAARRDDEQLHNGGEQ